MIDLGYRLHGIGWLEGGFGGSEGLKVIDVLDRSSFEVLTGLRTSGFGFMSGYMLEGLRFVGLNLVWVCQQQSLTSLS